MAKPTEKDLEIINENSKVELTSDEVEVFDAILIDDQPVSHNVRLSKELLQSFKTFADKGVGILKGHNWYSLPFGRTFSAKLKTDTFETPAGDEIKAKTLYSKFYLVKDLNEDVNEIIKGLNSGVVTDGSIGFSFSGLICNICGNDVRNWNQCIHIPGKEYDIDIDDEKQKVRCIPEATAPGRLLEYSVVFAGASPRAKILKYYDAQDKENFEFYHVDTQEFNLKNIDEKAKLYMLYSYQNGAEIFSDRPLNLSKIKDNQVTQEDLKETDSFNYTLGKDDKGMSKTEEAIYKSDSIELDSDVVLVGEDSTDSIAELQEKVAVYEAKLNEIKEEKETLETTTSELKFEVDNLKTEIERLTVLSELGIKYREDNVEEAIKMGIRAQGDCFNEELQRKIMETLTVDEILSLKEGWKAESDALFTQSTVSEPVELQHPEDKVDIDVEKSERELIFERIDKYADLNPREAYQKAKEEIRAELAEIK